MMQMLYIIMLIILAALAFGIINTMLMAILERRRELGMLMAVGMNKTKLFSMVVIETIFLSLISGPLGLLVAYLSVEYFKVNGMDFSSVAAGLEDVGYSTIVYFDMDPAFYFGTLVMVVATAILSSIYPAYKALQLNPVESIRGI
jgi:putative ABC transport system permease protein